MYVSVYGALANDVLPSKKEYAKDLSIWNASSNVPSIIIFILLFILYYLKLNIRCCISTFG